MLKIHGSLISKFMVLVMLVSMFAGAGSASAIGISQDGTPPSWSVQDPSNDLTVSDVTATTATLSWPVATDEQSATITYNLYTSNEVLFDSVTYSVYDAGPLSYTLTGLTPGTNYTLYIQPVDETGNEGNAVGYFEFFTEEIKLNLVHPDKVPVNTNTTVTVQSENLNNLYAFDLYFNYDTAAFDYLGASYNAQFSAGGHVSVISVSDDTYGELRFVGTRTGADMGLTSPNPIGLVDIQLQAKTDPYGTYFGLSLISEVVQGGATPTNYSLVNTVASDVYVVIPVTSISIDGVTTDITLARGGGTHPFTVTFEPYDATDQGVMWSSSDEGVATVVNGVVTPVQIGTTTITATSTDNPSIFDTATVTVNAPATGIQLSSQGMNLYNNQQIRIKSGASTTLAAALTPSDTTDTVQWISDDENVAIVNQFGVIQGVGLGAATITATAGGVSSTIDVIVQGNTNFSAAFTPFIADIYGNTSLKVYAGSDVSTITTFSIKLQHDDALMFPSIYEMMELDILSDVFDGKIDSFTVQTDVYEGIGTTGITVTLTEPVTLSADKELFTLHFYTEGQEALSQLWLLDGSYITKDDGYEYSQSNTIQSNVAISNPDLIYGGKYGQVELVDVVLVAQSFGITVNDNNWRQDMNKDGVIDIIDIAYMVFRLMNSPYVHSPT